MGGKPTKLITKETECSHNNWDWHIANKATNTWFNDPGIPVNDWPELNLTERIYGVFLRGSRAGPKPKKKKDKSHF